jgi:hypothetical protein
LTTRKIEAASGFATASSTTFWSTSPRIPTGIVAAMTSQARRSVEVSMRRLASVAKNARMSSSQVRQK